MNGGVVVSCIVTDKLGAFDNVIPVNVLLMIIRMINNTWSRKRAFFLNRIDRETALIEETKLNISPAPVC